MSAKPTVTGLGVDPDQQRWQRSGPGPGAIEIAFIQAPAPGSEDWVLMRVTGDAEGRVLVFDRHEWECFLDGARNGEFDDAAQPAAVGPAAPERPGRLPFREMSCDLEINDSDDHQRCCR